MEPRSILPWLQVSEPVSSLSHLAGAIFVALASARLLRLVGDDARRRRAAWLYLFGVGGMFLASGVYHFVSNDSPIRGLLWRLDHAMIWMTIAGTIAAIHLLADLRPRWLGVCVWLLAFAGLVIEQTYLDDMAPWVSPALYVGMGWTGLISLVQLKRTQGARLAGWTLSAGVTCTLGGVCDALAWPRLWPGVIEGHEVLHLMIAAGMAQFYVAVHGCASLVHDGAGTPPGSEALSP